MGQRTRMSAEDRRAQLLSVARQCFADHGFARTTTAMIAACARVSEPILYRHFDSKLDLFHAILCDLSNDVRRHFETITASAATGGDKLMAIIRDFPDFSRGHRCLFRVVDRALAGAQDEKTRAHLREYYSALERIVAGYVDEGRADGSVCSHVSPAAITWLLIISGVGLTLLSTLEIPALDDSRVHEEVARLVVGRIDRP